MINNEFDNNTTKNINKEPVGSFYQGIIDEYNESVNEGDDILNTSDSYKMTGVLNKETVNVFEKGLEDISDDGLKDYNIKTYNQGDSNSHNVVNKEEFLKSIKLLKNHIVEKVNEIKNGNIKPNPYKWSMSSNCDYCNLKSLCKREDKFDMGEEDNE